MAKMNPQRLAFKEAYCNPESDSFGNAYQSALTAGFSEEYAKNITGQGVEWVSEIIRDQELIGQAEKNLKELLTQVDDIKVKADITKFVTSTLGKRKYSTRTEMTGADGKDLIPQQQEEETAQEAITAFLYGEDSTNTDG